MKIINNGGWHFSQLKSPEDIEIKLTHSEDHYEYKLARKNLYRFGLKRHAKIYTNIFQKI